MKPISYLILLIIFLSVSFMPVLFISMNLSGEKVSPLNFYLSFIKNKNFFGEDIGIKDFFDFSGFNLKEFFCSQIGLLFLITFFSAFFLYHIFLPSIYNNLNGEKFSFIFKNSLFIFFIGIIQLIIYSLLISIYIYMKGSLKNLTDAMILETYKIFFDFLLNFTFILFLLIFRYFFSFLKVFLSFENFSFSIIKKSIIFSFKNFFKLTIFHLILFGLNYALLNFMGGNIINLIFKTYFFLLSLSYYLSLKEEK